MMSEVPDFRFGQEPGVHHLYDPKKRVEWNILAGFCEGERHIYVYEDEVIEQTTQSIIDDTRRSDIYLDVLVAAEMIDRLHKQRVSLHLPKEEDV